MTVETPPPLPAEPFVSLIGMGPGQWEDLTLRAAHRLLSVRPLFTRMAVDSHPVTRRLAQSGQPPVSFEPIYAAGFGYWERYHFMADIVVNAARLHGHAAYSIPGSLSVFERTSRILIDRCRAEGLNLDLVSGVSALTPSTLRWASIQPITSS